MKPPCANWSVWVGPEVEGSSGLGERTLFIRQLPAEWALTIDSDLKQLRKRSNSTRVWFCKEFLNWPMLEAIAAHYEPGNVCIEVEPNCFESLPRRFRQNYRIYVKLDLPLKPGDHVCVGPAFSDESFEMGHGSKVLPEQYLKDIKIA